VAIKRKNRRKICGTCKNWRPT